MSDHECSSADAEARDDSRCLSLSWADHGGGPLLRCELKLNHKGHHQHFGGERRQWTEAHAEAAFEPDRGEESRCSATAEPLGGATVRCQDVPGHAGRHVNWGYTWGDKGQVRRDAAVACCNTVDRLVEEVEEAEREAERLRAGLSLLLDAVSDLDDDARASFPEAAVTAAVTALARE